MECRKLLLLAIPFVLQGCSARAIDMWAQDMGLKEKEEVRVEPEMRECVLAGMANGMIYIDAHSTYFDPRGFAIVYGQDGRPCRLNLRYLQ